MNEINPQENSQVNSENDLDNTDDQKINWKRELMEWVKSIAFAFIAALLITKFIFTFTVVRGKSMFPTLHNSDRLVELKIDKIFYKYDRGDIVVIKDKELTGNDFYVKRIVAVGGDNIKIMDGQVILNGQVLEENYIDNLYTEGNVDYTLEDDEVFVLGDNRLPNASKDSRFFGPVNRKSIDGRCVLRVFPFNRFGGLNWKKNILETFR